MTYYDPEQGASTPQEPSATRESGGAWVPYPASDSDSPGPVPAAAATGAGAEYSPPPAARSVRRRRVLPLVLSVGLVAVAAGGGFAVGHEVWPASAAVSSAAPSGSASPSGSGNASSGSGNTGTGSGSSSNPFSGYGGYSGGNGTGTGSGDGTGTGNGTGTGSSSGPSDTAAIAAKVDPALVDINSTFSYQSAQGAGTGIVLTSNGEILTNNHVINGATKISVTDVGNGQTYSATVVGYDPSADIAVLQLQDAHGLQIAKIGDSSAAAVGESVVAIGNAGGTGGTPSSAGGSITALDQSITAGDDLDGISEQLSGLIETNADVQPGDSGGSLVNTAGEVVGMDTAASQGFSFQSSGTEAFAIPINQALTVAHQIESGQGSTTVHVGTTAFLGVVTSSTGDQTSPGSYYGGTSGGSSTSGVTVGGVVSGGTAAEAGLVEGDVITSLGGQSVDSSSGLSGLLIGDHAGDKVQLGWVDSSGQAHTATVVLASGPPA